jgi:hypothetical protein
MGYIRLYSKVIRSAAAGRVRRLGGHRRIFWGTIPHTRSTGITRTAGLAYGIIRSFSRYMFTSDMNRQQRLLFSENKSFTHDIPLQLSEYLMVNVAYYCGFIAEYH